MIEKAFSFVKYACLLFLLLTLCSCSCIPESSQCNVYKIKWKELYLNTCSVSASDWWCKSILVSDNVDKKTFQVIDTYANVNDYPLYAKDKNAMFFWSSIIVNADPNTYEFIDQDYWKDKNHVFYQGKIIEKADPTNFITWVTMKGGKHIRELTNDSKDYYLRWIPLSIDASTFTIMNWEVLEDDIVHAKDKAYYYVINISMPVSSYFPIDKLAKKFTVSDIDSLEFLGEGYAKDKNHAYYYGETILDADTKTFKNSWSKFAVDWKYVYVEWEKVTHIDPESFFVTKSNWVRWNDKNWCYSNYKWTKLTNCWIKK